MTANQANFLSLLDGKKQFRTVN